MTSRQVIRTGGLIALSLLFHLVLFSLLTLKYEPAIRFTRKRSVIKIHPYRPLVPRRIITSPVPKKGPPTTGMDSEDKKGGIRSEEFDVGNSKPSPGEEDLAPAPETARGERVEDSVLKDFFALIQSEEFQKKMEKVRREKEKSWAGKGLGEEDLARRKGGEGGTGKYQEGYLDPRVKLVVVSYPPSSIEKEHPYIRYPELKVKKHELPSGWCNVVIRIYTDERGRVWRREIVRPKGGDARDRLFLEHTLEALQSWSFPPQKAEVIIDVRYFVE